MSKMFTTDVVITGPWRGDELTVCAPVCDSPLPTCGIRTRAALAVPAPCYLPQPRERSVSTNPHACP